MLLAPTEYGFSEILAQGEHGLKDQPNCWVFSGTALPMKHKTLPFLVSSQNVVSLGYNSNCSNRKLLMVITATMRMPAIICICII